MTIARQPAPADLVTSRSPVEPPGVSHASHSPAAIAQLPIRISLVGSSELILSGLAGLIGAQAPPGVVLVDPTDLDPDRVDAVLVGTDTSTTAAAFPSFLTRVHDLVTSGFDRVVTFGPPPTGTERRQLQAAGARGHVSSTLNGADLNATLAGLRDIPVAEHPHVCTPPPASHAAFQLVGFSEREGQVVTLICTGASNYQIAAALYLSENTIKTYIRSAYRKISVTRRTDAVLWGARHGIHAGGAASPHPCPASAP